MRKDTFAEFLMFAFNGSIAAFDLAISQCDKCKKKKKWHAKWSKMGQDFDIECCKLGWGNGTQIGSGSARWECYLSSGTLA